MSSPAVIARSGRILIGWHSITRNTSVTGVWGRVELRNK